MTARRLTHAFFGGLKPGLRRGGGGYSMGDAKHCSRGPYAGNNSKIRWPQPSPELRRLHASSSNLTVPESPSTSIVCPCLMRWVQFPVPTTAGMPYSRATIEP